MQNANKSCALKFIAISEFVTWIFNIKHEDQISKTKSAFTQKPGTNISTVKMLQFVAALLFLPPTVLSSEYCTDHVRFGLRVKQCDELIHSLGDSITHLNAMCASRRIWKTCAWTCHSCHIKAKTIKKESLKSHNRYRKVHRSVRVEWSDELQVSATQQCQKMAGLEWDSSLIVHHVGSNTFHGINIRHMSDIARYAIRHWYNTRKFYDYPDGEFKEKAAEFTRMIWNGVKSIGCGIARSQDFSKARGVTNHIFFCCHYNPAGNFKNLFSKNVMKPKRRHARHAT